MERVLNFLNSLDISKNEYLIVGCSGGSDSMMLLNLLNNKGYKVVCAHINHKTREECDSECEFVASFCYEHNIIFESTELLEYPNNNFENYAREFRYNFFESLISKYNSNYLFTAHHGDDLVETILMRISRGSSLKGYRGFDCLSNKKDYKIVRPLVYLTKDDIIKYLDDLNIKYVNDSSNDTDMYTRNRYRHHILPFLKEEESDIHLRFLKFNEVLGNAYSYIDRVVNNFLDKYYSNRVLDISEFNELDPYIQEKVIEEIFRKIFVDNLYLINNNHVTKIFEIIYSNKPNINVKLLDNLYINKSYNKLSFLEKEEEIHQYEVIYSSGIELGGLKFKEGKKSSGNSNYIIRLKSRDLDLPLKIRCVKNGDRISIKNMNGSKKINDIFIDSKVPAMARKSYPILVDSSDRILWVPGIKKSIFDIPKNGLYDIIIECEKGEESYE